MELSELGEFGLIREISRGFSAPEGVRGIGDDCAVIPQHSGTDTLVSSDMLVEGSHFLLDDMSPYRLGWKSAAVNLSDIAAMGGRPVATFLSFALPQGLSAEWVREFMRGYREISLRFGCPLLGGDTTSSPDRMSICVTVLGECPHGASRLRSYARVGDLVCVSGCLGDSAAGLRVILQGIERDEIADALVEKHYLPMPRVAEGLALASAGGVHAMMDISDGIGSDLRHILEASGVGAEIDVSALPLSPELRQLCSRQGWDPVELATCGGEDYELLFTVAPVAESALKVPHFVIGRITAGAAPRQARGPQSSGIVREKGSGPDAVAEPRRRAAPRQARGPQGSGAVRETRPGTDAVAEPSRSAAPDRGAQSSGPDLVWLGASRDYLGFRHF